MKLNKLFYLLLITCFCTTIFAQEPIVFDKKYRFEDLGCGTTDVKQTPDSGYIAVGNTSLTMADRLFLIYKTDSLGNLEWYNQFGMQASELWGVDVTVEGDYIAIGHTEDNSE